MTTPEIHIPKPVLWPVVATGTAIGWAVGALAVSVGWVTGRLALIASYFAEAVVYGFRMGAKMGPKHFPKATDRSPRAVDNSKAD